MPDPLHEDHVLECVVFGTSDGQAILNVFHWQLRIPPGSEVDVTVDDVAVALRSGWRAGIRPNLHVSYIAHQYQVTAIDGKELIAGSNPPEYKLKYGLRGVALGNTASDFGGRAGDPLPTFAGMGFIKRTNAAGRDGRGAMRLAPIVESDIDSNSVDLVFGDALRDGIFTNLVEEGPVDAGKDALVRMVLFRKTQFLKKAAANEPPDGYTYDVKSIQTRPYASSQVSRKRKTALGQ